MFADVPKEGNWELQRNGCGRITRKPSCVKSFLGNRWHLKSQDHPQMVVFPTPGSHLGTAGQLPGQGVPEGPPGRTWRHLAT